MLEPRSTGAEARRIPISSLAPLMSSARLLLIDDDARLTGMVGDYLRAAGSVSYTHLTLPTILRV